LVRGAASVAAEDPGSGHSGSGHPGSGRLVPGRRPRRPAHRPLEPNTEGRLAATLARHGESWCATGAGADRRDAERVADERADAEHRRTTGQRPAEQRPMAGSVSVACPGRLARALVLDGPPGGPHRLLVLAATIGP
jgi:hypothetical protein